MISYTGSDVFAAPMQPVIFVFIDGLGLGDHSSANPLSTVGLPALETMLHAKLVAGASAADDHISFNGVDAVLGVSGIPQSATGQTSLLTGVNAQSVLGFHLPAFPNERLVEIIKKHSILKMLTDLGLRATFANAYSDNYFTRNLHSQSVTTHAVRAAGIPYRMMDDLLNNNAVYWDITRTSLEKRTGFDYDEIAPYDAGVHLVSIARTNHFVLFECFESDLIGHATDLDAAAVFFKKLDQFFSGILSSMNEHMSLVICSDHGNIENCETGGHTENMVPLIAIGPLAPYFHHIKQIDQVTPAIIDYFSL